MFNQPSTRQHHSNSCFTAEIRDQPWQAGPAGKKHSKQAQLPHCPVLEKQALPVSPDNSVYSMKHNPSQKSEADSQSLHRDQSLESHKTPAVQMAPHLEGFNFLPTPYLSHSRRNVTNQHGFSPQEPSHAASQIYESNFELQGPPGHPCLRPTLESHLKGMPLSGEEYQAHARLKARLPDPKRFQTKRYSFSTMPKAEFPCNVQGIPSRSGTTSPDVSVLSKLRQRERSYRGKRSQRDMAGDSYHFSPCKQFISEEKMAAKMSNLSITNDRKTTVQERLHELESRLSDSDSEFDSESDAKNVTSSHHPSIQVCPELKTALSQQKGILPDSIIKSMTNTCNQLVLWRPPPSCIGDITAAPTENIASQTKNISEVKSDVIVRNTPCTEVMEETPTPRNTCKIEHPSVLDNSSGLFDSMDDEMDL